MNKDKSSEKELVQYFQGEHNKISLKNGLFDPFLIAEAFVASIKGRIYRCNASKPSVAECLNRLGVEITLDRIELVQICLEVVLRRETIKRKKEQ